MRIAHKDWVCLLSDVELEFRRTAERRAQGFRFDGLIHAPLWRQIGFHADGDQLELELMNVDEEAALAGYWRCGYDVVRHKFTWDDLNDHEFLRNLFRHEQVCVMQKAQEILAHFRMHMVVLRAALVV